MIKQAFLEAYRRQLVATYAWAQDATKLERFMLEVRETIKSAPTGAWAWDGPATTAAWLSIGGKGHPTLKGLRELADERGGALSALSFQTARQSSALQRCGATAQAVLRSVAQIWSDTGMQWTESDQRRALEQGWGIFHVDAGHPGRASPGCHRGITPEHLIGVTLQPGHLRSSLSGRAFPRAHWPVREARLATFGMRGFTLMAPAHARTLARS